MKWTHVHFPAKNEREKSNTTSCLANKILEKKQRHFRTSWMKWMWSNSSWNNIWVIITMHNACIVAIQAEIKNGKIGTTIAKKTVQTLFFTYFFFHCAYLSNWLWRLKIFQKEMADAMLVHHLQCTNDGQILQAYNKSMLNIVFLFLCFFFFFGFDFVQNFQVLNEVQYRPLRMQCQKNSTTTNGKKKVLLRFLFYFIPFKRQITWHLIWAQVMLSRG